MFEACRSGIGQGCVLPPPQRNPRDVACRGQIFAEHSFARAQCFSLALPRFRFFAPPEPRPRSPPPRRSRPKPFAAGPEGFAVQLRSKLEPHDMRSRLAGGFPIRRWLCFGLNQSAPPVPPASPPRKLAATARPVRPLDAKPHTPPSTSFFSPAEIDGPRTPPLPGPSTLGRAPTPRLPPAAPRCPESSAIQRTPPPPAQHAPPQAPPSQAPAVPCCPKTRRAAGLSSARPSHTPSPLAPAGRPDAPDPRIAEPPYPRLEASRHTTLATRPLRPRGRTGAFRPGEPLPAPRRNSERRVALCPQSNLMDLMEVMVVKVPDLHFRHRF
jgi:hypothetical protein